ncbi:MAG: hypothetical protein A4E61_01089 [Syntrophorhabdus sp. PtaB.Bin184]|nr:MAG: hypothetical protein A4E61_01089 [Syntrophorhabdus sp. PtaB.Bin184]
MNINSINSYGSFWATLGATRTANSNTATRSTKEESPAYNVSLSDASKIPQCPSKLQCSGDWLTEEDKSMIAKMKDYAAKNGMDTKDIDALTLQFSMDKALASLSGLEVPTLGKEYLSKLLQNTSGSANTEGSAIRALDRGSIEKLLAHYDEIVETA